MLREQMINFLEAAVVFLLATNAASVLAALYAMRLANAVSVVPQAKSVIAAGSTRWSAGRTDAQFGFRSARAGRVSRAP